MPSGWIHITVCPHSAALKKLSSERPDFIRRGRGTVSGCWLNILQSNIVDGSRVLTSRVHVQEICCFQVKPVGIIQWQGNINARTRTHTPKYACTCTQTCTLMHTELVSGTAVMQYNLNTLPFWKSLSENSAFFEVQTQWVLTIKHSIWNWYASSASLRH